MLLVCAHVGDWKIYRWDKLSKDAQAETCKVNGFHQARGA